MSDTITGTVSGSLVFDRITGYRVTAKDLSHVHDILGSSAADIVDRPAGLRRGTLELLVIAEADAGATFTAFCTPQTFTLTSTTRPWIVMDFKRADGEPEIELDPDTRNAWLVRAPFVEVPA